MNRLEYLYFAIENQCYFEKRWIISAFTYCLENDEQKAELYPGKIIREEFGVFYLDKNLERQKIDAGEIKHGEPLYSKYDKLTITRDRLPWIGKDSIETTVGCLLVNLVCIYAAFNGRMPYFEKRSATPSDIENIFVSVLKDTPKEGEARQDGFYYVDELIRFQKAVTFLEGMSKIFSRSITRAGMLPAPGTEKFRKEVLARYQGKLSDPTEMVKFQEELNAFDKAYLKENDPTYGCFMTGKIAKARARAYLTQGGDANGFTESVEMVPITQPLSEGIDFTPEKFASIVNTIRYGSFARGAETVNGGVVADALMNALDTWVVTDDDCGSKLGVIRTYDKSAVRFLLDRYIIGAGGKPRLISTLDECQEFIDKEVIIRSPQYCRKSGSNTCKVCAGLDLSRFKDGMVIPAMEVSAGILLDSLKKMHDTTAKAKTMVLSRVIS